MFIFEWSVNRNTDVIGLLLSENTEFCTEFFQMQTGDFLIKFFVDEIDADLAVRIVFLCRSEPTPGW